MPRGVSSGPTPPAEAEGAFNGDSDKGAKRPERGGERSQRYGEPKLNLEAATVLVVPCYNEAQRLALADFRLFIDSKPRVAFLFVDDGSTDATRKRLEALQRERPDSVRVLGLPANRGKAAAVQEGMREALRSGATYAGYWDADLSTPLDEIPRMVDALERHPACLLLLGSRVRLLGRAIERRALRHYAGRLFATCASLTLGLHVYDTQCGAKLLRVCERTKLLFEEPFETGWIFDVELLARLVRAESGRPRGEVERLIHELPLLRWRDIAGSKVRAHHFAVALWELLRIHRRYRPRRAIR